VGCLADNYSAAAAASAFITRGVELGHEEIVREKSKKRSQLVGVSLRLREFPAQSLVEQVVSVSAKTVQVKLAEPNPIERTRLAINPG
jgi:hypothetical protein